MNKYKISEFAKLIGVCTKTLRRWDEKGLLKSHRTPTGHRFYTEEQYKIYMGILIENKVYENNDSSNSSE